MTFRERTSFTFKAWPAVAAAAIGLCYLTKVVAGRLGFDLPDQESVALLRAYLTHAFDSLELFVAAALIVIQVVVVMPVVEEFVFRWLLAGLPQRLFARRKSATRETRTTRTTRTTSETIETKPPSFDYSTIRLFDYSTVAFSSALFSAAHYVQQPWPDAAFLALFLFGVAQCWLYRRTGRLWCAMLNHALFNLTNIVLLFVLLDAA